MKNVNENVVLEGEFENEMYSKLIKLIQEMEESDENDEDETTNNNEGNDCFEYEVIDQKMDCSCNKLKETCVSSVDKSRSGYISWDKDSQFNGTLSFGNICCSSKEKDKLPKKVYFFTSSGIEKNRNLSYDIAKNKAKVFDAMPIMTTEFIQIDEDCIIENSFEGCKMESSDIYFTESSSYDKMLEVYNTIGILELKNKEDGTKFLFVKTKPARIIEGFIVNDQIKEMEDYLATMYEKCFSKDFDLIKNYIASESIDMELYPGANPCIIAGIQVIK